MDILTGSISGKIHFYRKKPNGTYAAGVTLKSSPLRPLTVGSSSAITVSDWDHDGDLDMILGNGEGAVYWAINQGTRARPSWGQPRQLKAGGHFLVADGGAAAPCVADWDGDGLPDLLLGSSSGKVVWCRNQGEKTKPDLAAPEILVAAFPRNLTREKQWFEQPRRSANNVRICVADWNGDGHPDLLAGDYSVEGQRGDYKLHGWVWVYLRQEAPDASAVVPSPNPPAAN